MCECNISFWSRKIRWWYIKCGSLGQKVKKAGPANSSLQCAKSSPQTRCWPVSLHLVSKLLVTDSIKRPRRHILFHTNNIIITFISMVITQTLSSVWKCEKNKTNDGKTNLEKHNSATNLISKRLSPVPGYQGPPQGCVSDPSTPRQICARFISHEAPPSYLNVLFAFFEWQ